MDERGPDQATHTPLMIVGEQFDEFNFAEATDTGLSTLFRERSQLCSGLGLQLPDETGFLL